MAEWEIARIIASRYVAKVGKYVVKLGYTGRRATEVWMTEKQLTQLEACFARTPHDHSTERMQVLGIWDERGYYRYARVEETRFVEPPQYNLKDLED